MKETWKDFFRNKRREILFLSSVGLAVLMLISFVGFVYEGGESYVSQDFIEAREDAVVASHRIVDLIGEAHESISQIAAYDSVGDHQEALRLAEEEAARMEQIRERVSDLSDSLENMVVNLEGVKPRRAEGVGKRAIYTGIQVAEGLVEYSKLSDELVTAVKVRLSGNEEHVEEIRRLINDMNREIRSINALNQEYQTLIREFDSLVGYR